MPLSRRDYFFGVNTNLLGQHSDAGAMYNRMPIAPTPLFVTGFNVLYEYRCVVHASPTIYGNHSLGFDCCHVGLW